MPRERDALITGIGLVSCLGDGLAAHRAALSTFTPVVDADSFAPCPVHPMVTLEFDTQIPKRGDQRQMEPWQRIGTYAAGLALEAAGVKGDPALLGRMDMIVAAGGGERDPAVDAAILSALPTAADPEALLNERLMNELRPTLFLAQLSNLLAGNISIVHGVVGSSRTFMGEEAAGADAVRIACARIAAGQGDLFLVGGSNNAQRPEMLLHYAMGRMLRQGGVRAGLGAAADRRRHDAGLARLFSGARKPRARQGARRESACLDRRDRHRPQPTPAWRGSGKRGPSARGDARAVRPDPCRCGLGASGAAPATSEEQVFLGGLGLPVRAAATAFGHAIEPSFPAALRLLPWRSAMNFCSRRWSRQRPRCRGRCTRSL